MLVSVSRETIDRLANEMSAEYDACSICRAEEDAPSHFHCEFEYDEHGDVGIETGTCIEGGRKWDPILQRLVGKPHCGCDEPRPQSESDPSAGAGI